MDDTWTGLRVGLYTRLSQDRNGTATSVERQDTEAREYAEGRGATIVGTWSDPDASASKESVHRPGFDELLAAATNGEIDGVAVWALDRLTRQPSQIETVIKLMRKNGLRLLSVKEGEIDTSAGALMARFLTWRAEAESERISQRVKSANRKAAQTGRPHTGGLRPFGHRRDPDTGALWAVPEEAEHLREAASRLISGETLYAIAKDWREHELLTPQGKEWHGSALRKMLSKPRIAGYRERDGEYHHSAPEDGGIEPILSEDTWSSVTATLADPQRKRPEVRTARHLLTGLIQCGRCGSRMVAGVNHGRHDYRCQASNLHGACGLVTASAVPVEQLVSAAWIDAFTSEDAAHAVIARTGDHREQEHELATYRQRLVDATRACFVDGLLSQADYARSKREIEGRIAEVERDLRRQSETAKVAALIGQAEQVWERSDLEERRALLRLVIATITIAPKGSTVGRFDPSRVDIEWAA